MAKRTQAAIRPEDIAGFARPEPLPAFTPDDIVGTLETLRAPEGVPEVLPKRLQAPEGAPATSPAVMPGPH